MVQLRESLPLRSSPPKPGEIVFHLSLETHYLILSVVGCGKIIELTHNGAPGSITLEEDGLLEFLLSDQLRCNGEIGWKDPNTAVLQLAARYLARYGCDTPAVPTPTYDLKKENSKPERTTCYSCSGQLREPYPGIKFCPKCEKE